MKPKKQPTKSKIAPAKKQVTWVVESEQGSNAAFSHKVADSFDKRVDANRHYKAMRAKWIYVRLYRAETVRTLIRLSNYAN